MLQNLSLAPRHLPGSSTQNTVRSRAHAQLSRGVAGRHLLQMVQLQRASHLGRQTLQTGFDDRLGLDGRPSDRILTQTRLASVPAAQLACSAEYVDAHPAPAEGVRHPESAFQVLLGEALGHLGREVRIQAELATAGRTLLVEREQRSGLRAPGSGLRAPRIGRLAHASADNLAQAERRSSEILHRSCNLPAPTMPTRPRNHRTTSD